MLGRRRARPKRLEFLPPIRGLLQHVGSLSYAAQIVLPVYRWISSSIAKRVSERSRLLRQPVCGLRPIGPLRRYAKERLLAHSLQSERAGLRPAGPPALVQEALPGERSAIKPMATITSMTPIMALIAAAMQKMAEAAGKSTLTPTTLIPTTLCEGHKC